MGGDFKKGAVELAKAAARMLPQARAARWGLRLALIAAPLVLIVVAVIALGPGGSGAVLALGEHMAGLNGVSKQQIEELLEGVDPKLIKKFQKEFQDDYAQALDCSNVPPAERRPGENCIDGLIEAISGKEKSAIPREAYWLIPFYKQAAKRYSLDWKLLAAINGARTRFGNINCDRDDGIGFYRLHESAWDRYAMNAGTNRLAQGLAGCYRASEPGKVYKAFKQRKWKRGDKERYISKKTANPYEAVDSIFTQARLLARQGAYNKLKGGWDYSGSRSNYCTTPNNDGRVFYAPDFDSLGGLSGVLGYNKKLKLPRWIIVHSAKWRRKHPPSTSMSGAMPTKLLLRYLETVWLAFGAKPAQAKANAKANLAQVLQESSGRSHAIQTVQDVNSGGNEAGGLLQFIPGTFDTWKVDGFNDRFAPLDNLLAGVNAQVNSDYVATVYGGNVKVLAGQGGWGPVGGSNPYAKGGKKTNLSKIPGGPKGKLKGPSAFPYKGKPQKDPVSKAVAWDGSRKMSPCYVAVVWDWYKAIEKYPPKLDGVGPGQSVRAPGGTRKIIGGGKFVPCPKAIPHDTSNGCYVDKRIIPDLLWIHKKYGIYITDGFAGQLGGRWIGYCCHDPNGDHPSGVGIDIAPAPGSSWDKIDALAKFAEPSQNQPRAPFRWVGYNGDSGHGRGHHLHLGWQHEKAGQFKPPRWVIVFGGKGSNKTKKSRGKAGKGSKKPAKSKKPSKSKKKGKR